VRERLEDELRSAYGNANTYLDKIDVRLVYKDITVEMLSDPEFEVAARKAKLPPSRHVRGIRSSSQ
jgi:hypothetical protein